jgi:hypothetical protein
MADRVASALSAFDLLAIEGAQERLAARRARRAAGFGDVQVAPIEHDLLRVYRLIP